jgi:ATP-dependent Clp protease ATP-binding subunit ClpB
MEVESKPEEIEALDRRIIQLKIEREALKKETDALEGPAREARASLPIWSSSRRTDAVAGRRRRKRSGPRPRSRSSSTQARGSSSRRSAPAISPRRASSYGSIPQLEKQLAEAESVAAGAMLREEVTPTISHRWSAAGPAFPSTGCWRASARSCSPWKPLIGKRVIGQDAAVKAVSTAVRRSRAGLQDPNRPLGSFLFLGPTGVGKTELTKALAGFLFDDDNAMVRIDMSEFMEKHSVARLIGAPPGYVGYEEGGVLTESVRRRPYQVILFDEVEKAHSDVFNILLQVLDDGRLTDGQGRTVDFSNTLIILTSNLGSQYLAGMADDQKVSDVEPQVMEIVRAHFRPEFLNRLDEIILFHRLGQAHMAPIVDIQVGRVQKLLKDRKISLELTEGARNWLGRVGYDPVYGARPLKRAVQRYLQDPLADMILRGQVPDGSDVKVDEGDGALVLKTD